MLTQRSLPTVRMAAAPLSSPGLDGQLRIEDAGGDAELLQEELEAVAAVHGAHEQQRLPADQLQLQQRVDEQELVLLLAFDGVLLQLAAVGQLRALQLQDHLRGHGSRSEQNRGGPITTESQKTRFRVDAGAAPPCASAQTFSPPFIKPKVDD